MPVRVSNLPTGDVKMLSTRSVACAGACIMVLVASDVAHAQTPRSSAITVDRGSFAVAPYAGYLITQSFFEGPLNAALSIQSSALYGVQASLPLAPNASIVGTLGYGTGDFEAGIPIIGGISLGQSSTLLMDASVELRVPSATMRFVPVFQLGGGAIRREVTVLGITADATDFQVSGAIGADFPLTQTIAIRALAKDHWGKADFGSVGSLEAKTGDIHTLALVGGVRIAF